MNAAIVLLLGSACAQERAPNILLITVDTLRRDNLGYAGGREGVSPTIDSLATRGIIFPNARSVSGWTLPSVATIMTGHEPRRHGMRTWESGIDATLTTMAQRLSVRGYSTAGFISHVVLRAASGLGSGFQVYDETVLESGNPHLISTARELTDHAITHVRDAESPFFVWVHYFEPHFAYLLHNRYRHFGYDDLERYDQEIAHTDAQIARLIDEIKERGELDNTIIIFTADHGEEFGEHGGNYHHTLYDEVLRVPFFVIAPGVKPGVNERAVEQVDILPTVLGLLDADFGELPGRNITAPSGGEDRIGYYERERPSVWHQRGIRVGDLKLVVIETRTTPYISDEERREIQRIENIIPGIYLYDLANDPGEQYNLSDDQQDEVMALRAALDRHFHPDSTTAGPRLEVDEELRKKLRSLGYLR